MISLKTVRVLIQWVDREPMDSVMDRTLKALEGVSKA